MKVRLPIYLLFLFDLLFLLAFLSLFSFPVLAFLGYLDFSFELCFSLFLLLVVIGFMYRISYSKFVSNKSRRDFSFSKWNLYQRFYPRLFKPKLLANEYILIPEAPTYLQYKTLFGTDDRIAYVILTNRRLIIDSLVLSENSPIKVSIWHSDADSAPRKKGLGQILDNFNSLNCSDYKVFQREDEAGRFLRIIIRPGRFELYLYHLNSIKLYEILKERKT